MPWEESQGNADDIDNAIARIRRWRKFRYRYIAWLLLPLVGAAFILALIAIMPRMERYPWGMHVLIVPMIVLMAAMFRGPTIILAHAKCPRCGLRFHRVSFFLKRFSRACRHCQLPINGHGKDEARTYWRDP